MNRIKYLALGIIAGFSFGTASIFIRFIETLSFYDIAFWRLILGATMLIIITLWLNRSDFKKLHHAKNFLVKIFLMGSFLALHFLFFIKSVNDTYILNATILVNTAPIITLLIAWLVKQDVIDLRDILSVLLAFLGIIIIANPTKGLSFGNIGDLEALLASLFISLYAVIGRSVRKVYGESPLLLASLIYLFALPIVFFAKIFLLQQFVSIPKNLDLVYVILLALIPTGIGHTFIVYALRGLKGHEVQLFGLLEPITASILALIFFNEIPPITSLIGSIFIVLGIITVSISDRE